MTYKKHLLAILIIGVIIWLVPSFTPKAQAADIEEGDLIRAIGDFDVWIVKYVPSAGSPQAGVGQIKKFKRLILNPDVFNMYGHLHWGDIKDIDQSIVDSFTESTLVRAEDDPRIYKLYPTGDTGEKEWIETAEIFLSWSFDWDAVYTINNFDRDSYVTGAPFKSSSRRSAPAAPVLEDPGTSVSSGTIFTITWSAPKRATSYTLGRDTNPSFSSPTTVYTGSNNTTTDNLTPSAETTYYWRVKATNAGGDSLWSNTVDIQVTVEEVTPLNAPVLEDPGISINKHEPFTLNWTSVEGAKRYWLQRDTSTNFSIPAWYCETNSYTDNPGVGTSAPEVTTTYYYRVKACDDQECSLWSNVVDMEVEVIVPPEGSITVTSPNGGEMWGSGSTHRITWDSVGVGSVRIEYIGGVESGEVLVDQLTTNPGYYDWAISADSASGNNFKIKVMDAENLDVFDWSDDYFRVIPPSITITSPNGGEVWKEGEAHRITWNSVGIDSVHVYINDPSISGSGSTNYITPGGLSVPAASGYYDWTIPSISQLPGGGGDNYKIRIFDASNATTQDYSDDFFSIIQPPSITVISPDGGEEWIKRNTHRITWDSVDVGSVRIEYISGVESDEVLIDQLTTNPGYYDWAISADSASGNNFKIKVMDAENLDVFDWSDDYFNIVSQTLTVTSPDGGEEWVKGNTYDITWTSRGIESVNIDVVWYGATGSHGYTLTSTAPAAPGKYSWTIGSEWPDIPPKDTYKIKVRVFSSPLPPPGGWEWDINYDRSDDYFSIVSP